MLEKIMEKTSQYMETIPKQERKKYGQFFTSIETARYMASLFKISDRQRTINILDAGAGTGILSCAVIERLEDVEGIEEIELTCYETDKNILSLLKENLLLLQNYSSKKIKIEVITENYITSQSLEFNLSLQEENTLKKYDLVIGNPPYMKISKDAKEAKAMPSICYGTPNLYFIFASMGLFNLKEEGEMVYIIPRSWTSGAYFKKFREYFLSEGKLTHIHLFGSRNKVFDKEDVLQETMIIKVQKTKLKPEKVIITSTNTNKDFVDRKSLMIPYDLVVSGEEKYVYLVTNEKEVAVLDKLRRWNKTLPDLGLRMKTGLTVDFRNKEVLRDEEEEGAIPLFYAYHIKGGEVKFPIKKEKEYIITEQKGLIQENKNYLFVKRFTAKEEPRRLQCGVYLAKKFSQYTKISTQNKLNFIDSFFIEMSECLVYGLYVLFNSTIYDEYYRILNGSTQVNATEINNMPVPELDIIQEMGRKILKSKDFSEKRCDMILEEYCG